MEQKERYVSKRSSCFYPWQGNKVQFVPIFDNKYIFKTMVQGFGLPQPKYVTSIGKDYEIKTFEQFKDFLFANTSNLIFKPIDGSGGRGIVVISCRNGNIYILDKVCTAGDLWGRIREGKYPYIVEECVNQDEEISHIYPWSLNTLRIITIKTQDNEWHIIRTIMRIGQNKCQVDNTGAGGITIEMDTNGKSYYAYDWSKMKEISSHPDTGMMLSDITIKQYAEASVLAMEASRKFGFMGSIGWDIGLSTNGPVLIEGNIFYDCAYTQFGVPGPLIPSHLANKLKRYRWWHRWDKTALYNKTDRYNIKA